MFAMREIELHNRKKYEIVYKEGGKHVAYLNDKGGTDACKALKSQVICGKRGILYERRKGAERCQNPQRLLGTLRCLLDLGLFQGPRVFNISLGHLVRHSTEDQLQKGLSK